MKTPVHQKGYTATAMIAMLAIGGIVTIGSARHTMSTVSETQGQAYGAALANVNRAVGTYTILYYKQLLEGLSIDGVTNSMEPTVEELGKLGLLNAEFNATPPLGGAYATLITREPAGCVAPNCNLTSRTWYTRPITNLETGNVDIEKLGAAAQALGGDGGWSAPDEPDLVRGTGGWSRTNPAGKTAGILVAINGFGSSVFSNYVDRTGLQGMLADLKLGGNNINDIGTVNAKMMIMPAGRNLTIGKTVFTGHESGDTTLYQPGSLWIEKPDSSPADIATVRNVNSQGQVTTNRLESRGDIVAAGNTQSNYSYANEVHASGWFRSTGNGGWYSAAYGGGLHMTDPDWIRSYNNKNMYTGGQMQAGSLQSNSTLSVAGNSTVGSQTVVGSQVVGGNHTVYGSAAVTNALTPGMIAWEGGYCGGNAGAIARDANNNLFVCN